MKNKKFLISGLAMAGFVKPSLGDAAVKLGDGAEAAKGNLEPVAVDVFRQDHLFHLTGHSSHASHASHASGSGGGGYSAPAYVAPAPVYVPPAPAPATTPLRGGTELFNSIVRRVQLGLQAYGYYHGAIDGVVGPGMKESLRRFQADYKFKVTGTVTPEVLDALKIAAR